MKIVRKDSFFICFAIVIRVFIDQQLIGWSGIAGLIMRVTWHGCNPKPPFIVKGELYRVCEIWPFFFRGKKFDFVPRSYFQFGKGSFSIEIFQTSVLFRIIISLYFRKFFRLRVGSCEIFLFTIICHPYCSVPNSSHLTDFLQLKWIIVRTKWIVPPSEYVHTIRNLIVISPKPVFLLNRFMNQLPISFAFDFCFAKNLVCQ